MTGRERILRTIKREPADRMPAAPFLFLNFVRKFYNDPDIDCSRETADVYRDFGFDIIDRNARSGYAHIPPSGEKWRVRMNNEKTNNGSMTVIEIETPEKTLRQVTINENTSPFKKGLAYLGNVKESFIKEPSDLDVLMKYMPPQPEIDLAEVKNSRMAVSNDGIIAPWVQGAFNFLTLFRSTESLYMDPFVDETFYRQMMDFFLERNRDIIAQYIQAGASVLSYAGNVANSRTVGPDFFEKYVFGYEKKLIDNVHNQDAMIIYHNCGYARNLWTLYKDLKIDVFETLTEQPFGDGDIDAAIDVFEGKVTLSGNIDQIHFLLEARPEEVYDKTKILIDKVRNYRHFIVAASDFVDENTPLKNLKAMADAVIDHGVF